MGIYKINLEGGFSHIIKTDITDIKKFIEKLIFTGGISPYVTTWYLHSSNDYKQNKVAIISNKVVSVEYYGEE